MLKYLSWALFAIALIVLPQIFTSILSVSIPNQMCIAIVFALGGLVALALHIEERRRRARVA